LNGLALQYSSKILGFLQIAAINPMINILGNCNNPGNEGPINKLHHTQRVSKATLSNGTPEA
jgi:hypothetical protein